MLVMFKLLKIERFSNKTAQLDVTQWQRTGIFKMPYFRNEGHYRSEDLSRNKFLRVLSHGGNKNLAGLANFDFTIL